MNNREIKCKIWLPELSKMVPPATIVELMETTPEFGFAKKAIFLEFCGLTETNKKEVYEGDVLRNTRDRVLLNWVVLFQDGCFGIKNIGAGGLHMTNFHPINGSYYFSDRELIGNIYENPELLIFE